MKAKRISEPQPHPHLDPARIEGGGETERLAGAAVVTALYVEWPGHSSDSIVNTRKVQPVEKVEGLGHQLQAARFAERDLSGQAEVEGPEVGTDAGVAAGKRGPVGGLVAIAVDVEPG